MSLEEIRSLILDDKIDTIGLNNIKVIQQLIILLKDNDDYIRKQATSIIFSSEFVPTDKILDEYLSAQDPLIRDIIVDKLHLFIPVLSKYLTKENSFQPVCGIINSLKTKPIQDAIKKAYKTTPVLASLTELSIRTCHSSIAQQEETLISFQLVTEHAKDVKKILVFGLKQSEPIYAELVLLTVTFFPELATLIEKQIRDVVIKSSYEEQVRYASIALMNLQDSKNADVLITRLSKSEDSTDTKLAIIESLGNLGNPKASHILIEQFSKGDPVAYYSAQSLAMLGDHVLPLLIKELEYDSKVPYIIETMKRLGETSYDYLMNALNKGKSNVRKNAAQCLTLVMSQKHGYEGAIRLLTSQLAGKNLAILESVTQALLALGTPSIRVLIEELADDDLKLRKNAAEVLQYFGFENIELALDGLLENDVTLVVKLGLILYMYYSDEEMQKIGYSFAISKNNIRVKDDVAYEIVVRGLKELDPDIREKSCELLYFFGTKSVSVLSSVLSDTNIRVRRKAVVSLRKLKNKRALITLIKAAKDNDDVIAEISTRALGELRDPGVIDVIIANMKRSKILVREAAVYAATQIGSPIAKKLTAQLNATNQNLVEATINALSKMDSKTLKVMLANLRTADERWYSNMKKVVQQMGRSAIPVLQNLFSKAKNETVKERLLILLSLCKDMSIIPTLVEFILGNKQSIGVQCFNNLGEDSIVKLLENLKPMSTKNRNLFVQNSKGLDGGFSVALLSAISKEKVLKSLAEPMLKVHNKAIRKYCQVKSLKYKDFVENWSK
ncbi:MAG: HEAT repeat domain-containing protein [Candidatus Heimdallarchaeota archaeon]|nr:HEAT repeat domain-containing protein [Candidatus Heimdallarchaeota archaeon]